MGTLVTITLYAESPEHAQQGFVAAFGRITDLDSILSDYKPDSELSRVCQLDGPLSRDLSTVLVHAQELAKRTEGAFDITAGPLIRLWRHSRSKKQIPPDEDIATAMTSSGFRKLELSSHGRRARCLTGGMELDAGGIAKGYAAGEALKVLSRIGIRSALIAVSGDVTASDPPPGQKGWRVRIGTEIVTITNAAVSTSGDQFQFMEIDGVRYSHIIDPRTGWPLRNAQTVSVIARSGMEADSLATALSVLGPAGWKPFSAAHKVIGGQAVFDFR